MHQFRLLLQCCSILCYICWWSSLLTVSASEEATKSDCALKCLNDGICQRRQRQHQLHRFLDGVIPDEPLPTDPDNSSDSSPPLSTQQQPKRTYGPYCQCPLGFTGVLCEVKFVTCATKEETCRNGSPCQRNVDWNGNEFFHCECDLRLTDSTASSFAAKVCPKAATVFCRINEIQSKAKQDKLHSVSDTAGSSFCYNNGSCKPVTDKRRHHAGCNCVDGYTGAHCETSSVKGATTPRVKAKSHQKHQQSSSTMSPRQQRILSVIAFIGIMLMFLLVGVAYLVYHGNRNRPIRSMLVRPNNNSTRQYRKASARERARIPNEVPISEIEVV